MYQQWLVLNSTALNKAIKFVAGLWPSTGRPFQGAAYGWRYVQVGVVWEILT